MEPQANMPTSALINASAAADRNRSRWSASELLDAQFPPMQWAVDGLIPVGLSAICGRPKVGKSWLALQAAHAVSTGGRFVERRAAHGRVLYLALEDSPERIRRRLLIQGVSRLAAIDFWVLEWPGWELLEQEIEKASYRLVVIDTVSRTMEGADQNDVPQMTAVYGRAQRVALGQNTSIVLVDHQKKGATSEEGTDGVLGSTAKAAVSEAILQLYKEQGRHEARLTAIGRDVEGDVEMSLRFDASTCSWEVGSENGGPKRDSVKWEVMNAIAKIAEEGELPTTTRISHRLGKAPGFVSRMLADLVDAGLVMKLEKNGSDQPYVLTTGRDVNGVNHQPSSLTPLTSPPNIIPDHGQN